MEEKVVFSMDSSEQVSVNEVEVVKESVSSVDLEWLSLVSDPSAEYEKLRSSLIDFVFADYDPEFADQDYKKTGRYIESDDEVLQDIAAKELDELDNKDKRRSKEQEADDDIFIDDLNIYGSTVQEEITEAERIVQNFFRPLKLPLHSEKPVEVEEAAITSPSPVIRDENKPSRLDQPIFEQSIDSETFTIGDSPVLQECKASWIAHRLVELTKLHQHEELRVQLSEGNVDSSLIKSINLVLETAIDESLEPAYIMLYKQSELESLQRMLYGFHTASTEPYASFTQANDPSARTDCAVCLGCGERQYPQWQGDDSVPVVFPKNCVKCSGQIRQRPCSIQLGRLVWDIVDLHFRFERIRSRVTGMVSNISSQPHVHELVQHFGKTLKHRYEIEFLDSYVSFLRDIGASKTGENCSRAIISKMTTGKLWEAYESWGMSGYDFSRNVFLGMCRYSCPFHVEPPLEWAAKFVSETVSHPSAVLTTLREYAIQEIAVQPIVLSKTMENILQHGFIEFRHGSEESRLSLPVLLEAPCGILSLLSDSSVELYVDMPDENWDVTLNFETTYSSPSMDSVNKLWNATRWRMKSNLIKEILRNIVPILKIVLMERAEWHISCQYLNRLDDIISVKGYTRCELPKLAEETLDVSYHDDTWRDSVAAVESIELDREQKTSSYPRVLAVHSHSPRDPTIFTQLNENGGVVRMWQWAVVNTVTEGGQEIFARQLDQLKNFTVGYRPHVVAVSATLGAHQRTARTGTSRGSLFDVLKEFFDHPMVEVVWTDVRVPLAFARSTVATEEFPMLSHSEKVSVSLGRFLRDPMLEVARLCNRHNDILRLRLVDEQNYLNQSRHRAKIDQFMSLWVSACGVDLNAVVSMSESELLLQYLSGLDYDKASAITRALNLRPYPVYSRFDLVSDLPCGPKIIQNCVGMMKIHVQNQTENPFELLDTTCIHPCFYAATDLSETQHEKIRAYSSRSTIYEQKKCVGKTMEFVHDELKYANEVSFVRRSFRKMEKSALFEKLCNLKFAQTPRPLHTGEMQLSIHDRMKSALTVHVGDRIGCRVLALNARGITVLTSKLVKGFIPVGKIGEDDSLEMRTNWLQLLESKPPRIRPGDHIDAIVVGINYDNVQLILSWKIQDEVSPQTKSVGGIHRQGNEVQTENSALSYKASLHKWFRPDIRSGEEAKRALHDGKRGEILLRHCAKNMFCMDFKVSDFHVVHAQVAEESMNGEIRYVVNDPAAPVKVYEDLDHCYVDYVGSMLKRVEEFEAHPRAFVGSLTALKAILKRETAETQKTSWRFFSSKRNPLYTAFVICAPKYFGEEVQCWPFTLASNGWLFDANGTRSVRPTLDDLLQGCYNRLRACQKM
ncbi:transcription elongation factor SPT6-like protein [Perkinsela sp. CCAP 1560/4]|nr:transcription elongation factor SPT6-like protein [Perkinsela sp. CCAP 1560/4]|eukprot:KNH09572.1 transcription elongation factor SPT6-like protein [Perkinsela sp. CCAP 1560/4]